MHDGHVSSRSSRVLSVIAVGIVLCGSLWATGRRASAGDDAPPAPALPWNGALAEASTAATARPAEDELPPAPAAPAPDPEAEAAASPGEPTLESTDLEETAPTPVPVAPTDFPAPTPRGICCPPAPCCPPARLERSRCCWPRDACGWALDACGRKLGKTEIVIEGTYTLFDDMEGPLGEPRVGSLSWNSNGYDAELGGRITLRHAVSPKDKVEVRAVHYGEFQASSTQTGAFGFSPPAGGSTAVTNAVLSSESELLSIEGNWWREFSCCGRLRWSHVIGVRAIRLDETAAATMPIVGAGAASVLSEVDTDFLGVQLGGAVHWLATRRVEASLGLKGLLGSMRRNVRVSDDTVFAGGTHAANSEENEFSFGAELELSVLIRLTRRLGLTAGYSLLFLDNVTRAHEAMDFSQAGTGAVQARQAGSELLLHTVFAGFQLNL